MAMNFELSMLAAAIVWGFVQLVAAAQAVADAGKVVDRR